MQIYKPNKYNYLSFTKGEYTMNLTYLGTAAAEGFPGIFCNCQFCREARKLKGKNIRTRSQAIVNDDLLIDLPADTYHHFLTNDIEGDKIKYLLVTHSHSDHFHYDELDFRRDWFAHDMRSEKLHVFCNKGTMEKFEKNGVPKNIEVNQLRPFEKRCIGDYNITALPARHYPGDEALFYVIERDKTILYAHDTGYFYEEVFEYIKDNKIRFDMASFDCTNADIPIPDTGHHMGIDNISRVIQRLKSDGAADDDTIMYMNHFSHNGNPIHHILEKKVENLGIKVSYDGCVVNI